MAGDLSSVPKDWGMTVDGADSGGGPAARPKVLLGDVTETVAGSGVTATPTEDITEKTSPSQFGELSADEHEQLAASRQELDHLTTKITELHAEATQLLRGALEDQVPEDGVAPATPQPLLQATYTPSSYTPRSTLADLQAESVAEVEAKALHEQSVLSARLGINMMPSPRLSMATVPELQAEVARLRQDLAEQSAAHESRVAALLRELGEQRVSLESKVAELQAEANARQAETMRLNSALGEQRVAYELQLGDFQSEALRNESTAASLRAAMTERDSMFDSKAGEVQTEVCRQLESENGRLRESLDMQQLALEAVIAELQAQSTRHETESTWLRTGRLREREVHLEARAMESQVLAQRYEAENMRLRAVVTEQQSSEPAQFASQFAQLHDQQANTVNAHLLGDQRAVLENRLAESQAEASNHESESARLRLALGEQQVVLGCKVNDLRADVHRYEVEVARLHEALGEQHVVIEASLREQRTAFETRAVEAQAEIRRNEAEVAKLRNVLSEQEAALEAKTSQAQMETGRFEAEIRRVRASFGEQSTNLEHRVSALQAETARHESQSVRLSAALSSEKQAAETKVAQLQALASNHEQEAVQLRAALAKVSAAAALPVNDSFESALERARKITEDRPKKVDSSLPGVGSNRIVSVERFTREPPQMDVGKQHGEQPQATGFDGALSHDPSIPKIETLTASSLKLDAFSPAVRSESLKLSSLFGSPASLGLATAPAAVYDLPKSCTQAPDRPAETNPSALADDAPKLPSPPSEIGVAPSAMYDAPKPVSLGTGTARMMNYVVPGSTLDQAEQQPLGLRWRSSSASRRFPFTETGTASTGASAASTAPGGSSQSAPAYQVPGLFRARTGSAEPPGRTDSLRPASALRQPSGTPSGTPPDEQQHQQQDQQQGHQPQGQYQGQAQGQQQGTRSTSASRRFPFFEVGGGNGPQTPTSCSASQGYQSSPWGNRPGSGAGPPAPATPEQQPSGSLLGRGPVANYQAPWSAGRPSGLQGGYGVPGGGPSCGTLGSGGGPQSGFGAPISSQFGSAGGPQSGFSAPISSQFGSGGGSTFPSVSPRTMPYTVPSAASRGRSTEARDRGMEIGRASSSSLTRASPISGQCAGQPQHGASPYHMPPQMAPSMRYR